MGNVIVLAWWLLLLAALQAAALFLDGSRHLEWGLLGIFVLKAVYLSFAWVVLGRYLSFMTQRNFETLAEAYQRTAGRVFQGSERRPSRWTPFFNLALAALAAADAFLAFFRGLTALRASILIDVLIWILIGRWITRAYWLKSRRARERLKEAVDDARSRSRSPEAAAEPAPEPVSPAPFALLAALSLAVSLGVGSRRWTQAQATFAAGDLKRCMEKCMRLASMRFYEYGEAKTRLEGEPCVRDREGNVDFALEWDRGNLFLRAFESGGSDSFGDGIPGNQGWVLDANGRFRAAWNAPGSSAESGRKP